jgi:O-antigen/teichoic acid export membrane protein
MARECASGDPRRGATTIFKYLTIAAVGGIVLAIAGMCAAAPISWLLFPAQPALLATVIRITIWSLPVMAVESVMGYSLNAAGKDAAQSRASAPAAIASLVISIALVTSFGVTGACFSMLLRPAVRAAFLAPLFYKTFHPADLLRPHSIADESVAVNAQPVLM